MIVFPAIDLQNGKAVRLKQGIRDQSTIFSDDPAAVAQRWADQGALWLHIIDLDGAFDGLPANAPLIDRICRQVNLPVQVGGGIRSTDTAQKYLDCGATRLIIGTMALENPENFAGLCNKFPGKIGVSLDAVNGVLKSRGWVKDCALKVEDAISTLQDAGAAFFIYTDIARDGMHSGINLDAMARLLALTDLPVIAAGGVSSIEDARSLQTLTSLGNLQGFITGRALYDGTLDLASTQKWLDEQEG